jgi:hypothetical protein
VKAGWLLALAAALALAPPQGMKTIAVSSVDLPRDFVNLPSPRARFDSLIVSVLRSEGFTVVPSAVSDSIWVHLRDSLGGYFDTYTGKLLEAKWNVVHLGTLRALKARYGAEAWLHPDIAYVGAPFKGGKVKWHGVEQTSGAPGGVGGFLFGTKTGSVPALSFFATVEDTAGKELYSGAGGIELAARIVGDRFVDVPRLSLLGDGGRNVTAVHLALDSLPARLGVRAGP